MKLAIVSDLHSDFGHDNRIVWPEADVLVIAGDTGNNIGAVDKFLKKSKAADFYPRVLMVDGNHEHYCNSNQRRTVDEALDKLRNLLPSNVELLTSDGDYLEVGPYTFLGCNGWYTGDFIDDFHNNETFWKSSMNDHRCIFSGITQPSPFEMAKRDSCYLEGMLQVCLEEGRNIVVVTHTSPSRHMCRNKWEDAAWQRANGFYFNSFNEKLLEKYGNFITLWVHGHIHDRKEKVIDGVHVVANPRGYPGELPSWEPLVLEI